MFEKTEEQILLNSLETISVYLAKRGYSPPNVDRKEYDGIPSYELIDKLQFTVEKDGETTTVVWIEGNLGSPEMKNLNETFDENDVTIVISEAEPTPQSKKMLKRFIAKGKYVDTFTVHELQFDCTDNVLVPPHRICSGADLEDVKKSYPDLSEYPIIFTSDPQCRAIGARVGDVIEITRSNEKSYRVVK